MRWTPWDDDTSTEELPVVGGAPPADALELGMAEAVRRYVALCHVA